LLAGVRARAWWPPRLAFAVQVRCKFRVRSARAIADAITEPLTPPVGRASVTGVIPACVAHNRITSVGVSGRDKQLEIA